MSVKRWQKKTLYLLSPWFHYSMYSFSTKKLSYLPFSFNLASPHNGCEKSFTWPLCFFFVSPSYPFPHSFVNAKFAGDSRGGGRALISDGLWGGLNRGKQIGQVGVDGWWGEREEKSWIIVKIEGMFWSFVTQGPVVLNYFVGRDNHDAWATL